MRSFLVYKAAQGLVPLSLLFSVYLLLRGHHQPGGGFIAALVTSVAIILQALAIGVQKTREKIQGFIRPLMWLGLLVCSLASTFGVITQNPFLTHFHASISTVIVFDVGVYMSVVGMILSFLGVMTERHP